MSAAPSQKGMSDATRGMLLGLLGVVLFAATAPMTKLAVDAGNQAQLSAAFVTFGRAAVAGILSLAYLLAVRASVPAHQHWGLLAFTACGVVLGFPLFLALALQTVQSNHAAVVTGLLPLATAAVAAVWFKQRPAMGFWICAVLGSALVVGFMMLRAGGLYFGVANVFLLLAMASAALGYVGGARLTAELGAERVICWVLVMSLPFTAVASIVFWPMDVSAVSASAWGGFAYVSIVSMWLGFFAWYRGLALGGAVRVSQVQLLQPFISIVFAVPLVGERLDALTVGFAIAVIATVFLGKRMSVGAKPS